MRTTTGPASSARTVCGWPSRGSRRRLQRRCCSATPPLGMTGGILGRRISEKQQRLYRHCQSSVAEVDDCLRPAMVTYLPTRACCRSSNSDCPPLGVSLHCGTAQHQPPAPPAYSVRHRACSSPLRCVPRRLASRLPCLRRRSIANQDIAPAVMHGVDCALRTNSVGTLQFQMWAGGEFDGWSKSKHVGRMIEVWWLVEWR